MGNPPVSQILEDLPNLPSKLYERNLITTSPQGGARAVRSSPVVFRARVPNISTDLDAWDAGSPKRLKGGIGSIFDPPGSARTISGFLSGMTFLPIGGWTMPPIPTFRGTRNNH